MSSRIAIIGAGYVGLPLAVAFAEAGRSVHLVDVDEAKVHRVAKHDDDADDDSDKRKSDRAAAEPKKHKAEARKDADDSDDDKPQKKSAKAEKPKKGDHDKTAKADDEADKHLMKSVSRQ